MGGWKWRPSESATKRDGTQSACGYFRTVDNMSSCRRRQVLELVRSGLLLVPCTLRALPLPCSLARHVSTVRALHANASRSDWFPAMACCYYWLGQQDPTTVLCTELASSCFSAPSRDPLNVPQTCRSTVRNPSESSPSGFVPTRRWCPRAVQPEQHDDDEIGPSSPPSDVEAE